MWRRLSERLHGITSGWLAIAALVIFLLFSALVLPSQSAQSLEQTGGAGSPDLSFLYTPEDLYRMAEAYGEVGRAAYVRARFSFDLIWPLVYAFFLSTSISWLTAGAFIKGSLWRRANLAPGLGMLFDYLENLSTSLVMMRYPSRTPGVDVLAPLFTAVKWVFVSGSFLLLLISVGVFAWKGWRSRTQ
jgi:hypothetical protein